MPMPGDPQYCDPGSTMAHSAHSAASSTPAVASRPSQSEGGQEAQHLVQDFMRNVVKGISVKVLQTNGTVSECIVSLDRSLKTMHMRRLPDGKKRSIQLFRVCGIVVGDDNLEDEELPATERCVTLLLEDAQALAMEFPNLEERDNFAICLSMFVDGSREGSVVSSVVSTSPRCHSWGHA